MSISENTAAHVVMIFSYQEKPGLALMNLTTFPWIVLY